MLSLCLVHHLFNFGLNSTSSRSAFVLSTSFIVVNFLVVSADAEHPTSYRVLDHARKSGSLQAIKIVLNTISKLYILFFFFKVVSFIVLQHSFFSSSDKTIDLSQLYYW